MYPKVRHNNLPESSFHPLCGEETWKMRLQVSRKPRKEMWKYGSPSWYKESWFVNYSNLLLTTESKIRVLERKKTTTFLGNLSRCKANLTENLLRQQGTESCRNGAAVLGWDRRVQEKRATMRSCLRFAAMRWCKGSKLETKTRFWTEPCSQLLSTVLPWYAAFSVGFEIFSSEYVSVREQHQDRAVLRFVHYKQKTR